MKKLRNIFFLLIQASVLVACSVKEDRTLCPSDLVVYAQVVTKALGEGNAEVRLYNDTGESYLEHSVILPIAELAGQGALMPVYKNRKYRVLGLIGIDDFQERDGGLFIPLGQECPPLQTFIRTLRTDESERDFNFYETFRREHFRLTINIVKGVDPHPFSYKVEGDVDGFILGEEVKLNEGKFSCFLKRTASKTVSYDCLIPRQGELLANMKIQAYYESEPAPVKTYSIGKTLMENGYQGDADILEDVYIDIDLSISRVTITVADWVIALDLEQIEI